MEPEKKTGTVLQAVATNLAFWMVMVWWVGWIIAFNWVLNLLFGVEMYVFQETGAMFMLVFAAARATFGLVGTTLFKIEETK